MFPINAIRLEANSLAVCSGVDFFSIWQTVLLVHLFSYIMRYCSLQSFSRSTAIMAIVCQNNIVQRSQVAPWWMTSHPHLIKPTTGRQNRVFEYERKSIASLLPTRGRIDVFFFFFLLAPLIHGRIKTTRVVDAGFQDAESVKTVHRRKITKERKNGARLRRFEGENVRW